MDKSWSIELLDQCYLTNDLHTIFEHITRNGPKDLRTFEPNPQIMKELQPAIFRAATPRCRPYVASALRRALDRYLGNLIMHYDSTARQLALKTGEAAQESIAISRTRWLKHSLDHYFDMIHHKLGQFADSSLVWGWALKNLPRLINMQLRHYTLVSKKIVDDYQITSADWWTERTRWFERVRYFGAALCSCSSISSLPFFNTLLLMVLLHRLAPENEGDMLLPCFQGPGFSHPMPLVPNTRNTIHNQSTTTLQFGIRNSLVNSHFRNPMLFPIALNPPFPAEPTQKYPLDPCYITPAPQGIRTPATHVISRTGPNQAGSLREWISAEDQDTLDLRLCLP